MKLHQKTFRLIGAAKYGVTMLIYCGDLLLGESIMNTIKYEKPFNSLTSLICGSYCHMQTSVLFYTMHDVVAVKNSHMA